MPPKRIAYEKPAKWVARSGLLLGLLLAVPVSAHGQDESRERFQLFTSCAGMGLEVVLSDNNDDLESLTVGQIERAVRSRLRAARLYRETSTYVLWVRVAVAGEAFRTDLFFYKPLRLLVPDVSGRAITWFGGGVGTHASGGDYVISVVSQHMDGFLDEYLRVNEEACAPSFA